MDVFVYSTPTDPAIADRDESRGAAAFDGLQRVGGAYPTLAPGGTCDGRVLSTSVSTVPAKLIDGVWRAKAAQYEYPLQTCFTGSVHHRSSGSAASRP